LLLVNIYDDQALNLPVHLVKITICCDKGITRNTKATDTPAYLSQLIHDYQLERTLWSADELLLSAK